MSSDSEQEYFADGISEEILNLLAHIRELRVISRSSSFALKGRNLEVPEIADMLDVAHVLEGSVRKSGNTVRVTAQLIEAKTDTHLWSKTYDRELEDLFVIQDEIAADVARNMHLKILQPLPNSRVIDPEVRALTQQASQVQEMRQDDIGQNMHVLLDRALAIDPLCYQCLYRLSRIYMLASQYEKAESARTRYLATGGNGGQIHYSLIKLLQGDTDAAAEILVDLPDSLQTWAARGTVAYSTGNFAGAQAALEGLLASEDPYAQELVAELSAWMNEKDLAFETLTALKGGFSLFSPMFRNLHDDPRWDELRESIGMSRERLDAIEFILQLPE